MSASPQEPTVAQQAAIRQAGANQDVNAGVTTQINEDPSLAASTYQNLETGTTEASSSFSSEAGPMDAAPPTHEPGILKAERDEAQQNPNIVQSSSSPRPVSLSRFNQANEGGYSFRQVRNQPVNLSRFNQSNEGGYVTTERVNETPPTLNRFNQSYSDAVKIPTTFEQAAKAYPGLEEFYRDNPNPLIAIGYRIFPKQTVSLVGGAGSSVISPVTGSPDLIGGATQFVLSGGKNGSELKAFQNKGISYDVGDVLGSGVSFIALAGAGEALGAGLKALGVSGRVASKVATPIAFGTFSGAVTAAAGGSPLDVGESFVTSALLVGVGGPVFGRLAKTAGGVASRAVEEGVSQFTERPFSFATFKNDVSLKLFGGPDYSFENAKPKTPVYRSTQGQTASDLYAPQFDEGKVLVERGARDVTMPTISGRDVFNVRNQSDIKLSNPVVEGPDTGLNLKGSKLAADQGLEDEFSFSLKKAKLARPSQSGLNLTGSSLRTPAASKEFLGSDIKMAFPKFKPLLEPLTQGELNLLAQPEFKFDLEENPYLRTISSRRGSPGSFYTEFEKPTFGSKGGGANTGPKISEGKEITGSKSDPLEKIKFKESPSSNPIVRGGGSNQFLEVRQVTKEPEIAKAAKDTSFTMPKQFTQDQFVKSTKGEVGPYRFATEEVFKVAATRARLRKQDLYATDYTFESYRTPKEIQGLGTGLDTSTKQNELTSTAQEFRTALVLDLTTDTIVNQAVRQSQVTLQKQVQLQTQRSLLQQDTKSDLTFRFDTLFRFDSFEAGSMKTPSLFFSTKNKHKQRKKRKGSKRSYREFGNYLNLKQFEFF